MQAKRRIQKRKKLRPFFSMKGALEKSLGRELGVKDYQKALFLSLKSLRSKKVKKKIRKPMYALGDLKRLLVYELLSMNIPLEEISKNTGINKRNLERMLVTSSHRETILKRWAKPGESEKASKRMEEIWKERTPEEKKKISRKASKTMAKKWEERSEEEKEEYAEQVRKRWERKSDLEKELISRKVKEIWAERTPEEREEIARKISEGVLKQWERMTPEQKEERARKISGKTLEKLEEIKPEEIESSRIKIERWLSLLEGRVRLRKRVVEKKISKMSATEKRMFKKEIKKIKELFEEMEAF